MDENLQLVIIRDPRAAANSMFFMLKKDFGERFKHTLDEYVLSVLPSYCQRTLFRVLLFGTVLRSRTLLLFYEDILAAKVASFGKLVRFFGMNLPGVVIEALENAPDQPFEEHTGETRSAKQENQRSFKDEVSPETVFSMDEIMRGWLPSELLVRWNVYGR
ncbi:unnamed protein product [Choristocarpus tenellus]